MLNCRHDKGTYIADGTIGAEAGAICCRRCTRVLAQRPRGAGDYVGSGICDGCEQGSNHLWRDGGPHPRMVLQPRILCDPGVLKMMAACVAYEERAWRQCEECFEVEAIRANLRETLDGRRDVWDRLRAQIRLGRLSFPSNVRIRQGERPEFHWTPGPVLDSTRIRCDPKWPEPGEIGYDLGAGASWTALLCRCGYEAKTVDELLGHARMHGWTSIQVDGCR